MIPLACVLAAVFTGLALIHVYWAAGGGRGASAAIPETDAGGALFRPGPALTLIVAGLLALAAVTLLVRVGLGPSVGPRALGRCGYTPLALALGLGAAVIAACG